MSTTPRYPVPFREILARIEAKTFKIEGGCYLWQGSMHEGRSPVLKLGTSTAWSVRKILYESRYEPLPPWHRLKMTCSVERCIKIEHMKAFDTLTLARRGRSDTSPFPQKYSDALVRRVFEEYRQGKTCDELSAQYGPDRRTILAWITGRDRRRATGLLSHLPGFITKGHDARGERQWNARLNWAMVLVIHGLLRAGYRSRVVARDFGIARRTIVDIRDRKRWKWLTAGLPDAPRPGRWQKGEECPQSKLTAAQVVSIRHLYQEGHRQKDLARTFQVSVKTIAGICQGRAWAWLTAGLPETPAPEADDLAQQDALVRQHWEGGS